jgi:hypothetical protein
MRTLAAIVLALAVIAVSEAAGRTEIARVDDYIDAPRALFGRTRVDLERRLGTPVNERVQPDGVALSWPGLEIMLSPSARVVGVVVHAAGRALPLGLDVGATTADVQATLGEPVELTDERAVYTDADGFPNSVEFLFRGGRVTRIRWRFWAE